MSERVKRADAINYLFRLLFIFCLLVASSAWGDFQAGEDAHFQSDYATALKEFRPLAEEGDAKAQFLLGWFYHRGKLFNYVLPDGSSDIFIYYSGHGAPDVKSSLDEKPSYLVPVDANPSNVSFGGYPLDVLYQNLKQTPYRHATVVIDACFSGTSAGGTLIGDISGLGLPTLEVPGISQDRSAIFTATGSQQVANWYRDKQHSLFTYFFLKALRGEADVNGDNRLTASEVSEYVGRQVLMTARRYNSRDQNPQLIGNQDAVLVTY